MNSKNKNTLLFFFLSIFLHHKTDLNQKAFLNVKKYYNEKIIEQNLLNQMNVTNEIYMYYESEKSMLNEI